MPTHAVPPGAGLRVGLDFGTSNTVLMRDLDGQILPLILDKELLADRTGTPVLPSAVYLPGGAAPAWIGEKACLVNHTGSGRDPRYAEGFKRHLGQQTNRPVARVEGRDVTAGDAARAFFDGLRGEIQTRYRPRRPGLRGWWEAFRLRRRPLLEHLVLTAPVDADEAYRDELASLGRRLGVGSLQIVDEPVAAALGYGVTIQEERLLLVCDWGGGTLDVAVVRAGPQSLATGRAAVLARGDAPVGGNDVDRWIVERFLVPVERYVTAFDMDALWAAREAKERAALGYPAEFRFRDRNPQPFSRGDLIELLTNRCAYATLERALDQALAVLAQQGTPADAVQEVLLVGGSSKLPEVDDRLSRRFPMARVSEWNPFAAVGQGALVFARGGQVTDRIYHDYALGTVDGTGRTLVWERILAAGTEYPTPAGATWTRQYQRDPVHPDQLRLVVREIARLGYGPIPWQHPHGRPIWQPQDPQDPRLRIVGQGELEVPLPPAPGASRSLQVEFRVDGERYLRFSLRDGGNPVVNDAALVRLR